MVKTYSKQGVRVQNPDQNQKTLVLIGRSGNGKSALGNCILGRNAFPSEASPCGVTLNCALEEGLLPDGGMLRIIDTPGHFGHSLKSDVVDSEIRKCFEMAKDEIHALILVLSVNNRFTKAETEGILALTSIFGWNMYNSLVVVFTGGDDLERDGQTLDDFLGPGPPESLQILLNSCDNRFMVFDCNTLDENKRSVQLSKLLKLVEIVTKRNGGKPFGRQAFSPNLFLKRDDDPSAVVYGNSWEKANNLKEDTNKLNEELLKHMTEKVKDFVDELETQLERLKEDLQKLEDYFNSARSQLNKELDKLGQDIGSAQREIKELSVRMQRRGCSIL